MPDAFVLFGPQGTSLDVGSYLQDGPDFGLKGLRAPEFAENALAEGGVLAYERSGVRTMVFPLLLASVGSYGGLDGLAAHLGNLARPGGYIDLIPQGVATANRIRFDVLHGELSMRDYSPHVQRIHRRRYDLTLRVPPFGYMPTWVRLASAASVGLPGFLTVPGASVMGDAPGLVRFTVQPTCPANATGPPGTWVTDALAWSLGGLASFTSLLHGASWTGAVPSAAYAARAESVAGTVLSLSLSPTHVGWTQIGYYTLTAALEPAYRGRHRAYLHARQGLDVTGLWNSMQLSLDAVMAVTPSAPMGSAAVIATLAPQAPSSFAPAVLDLGEITLPPVASGLTQAVRLRLWAAKATYAATTAHAVEIDDLSLLPVGLAGVMPRGVAWPDFTIPTAGRLALDSDQRTVMVGVPTGDLATTLPARDGLKFYRGDLPRVGGSTLRLDLIAGARRAESATAYLAEVIRDAPLFLYRFEEATGATLIDSSGNARHGSYVNAGSYAQPGAFNPADEKGHFFDGAANMARAGSAAVLNPAASSFSVEFWARRERPYRTIFEVAVAHGTQAANYQSLLFGWRPSSATYPQGAVWMSNTNDDLQASYPVTDVGWHHYVFTFDRASGVRLQSIWLDASCIATKQAATTLQSTGPFWLANASSIGNPGFTFAGGLDAVAYYAGILPADRIRAHYEAGKGATSLLTRPAPLAAAVQLSYRPRFTFLPNI